ncbi:MAG: radical SAM protein [Bacteroidetes bacterium]|nr:radical SAM protein [Bacteroidota bacterium]
MSVFLLTPPFTQLNTPYPATAYLKGFLNTKNIASFQADLGIEVMLEMFSSNGLTRLFQHISSEDHLSDNAKRIYSLRDTYVNCIDPVIHFLQGNNPTISYQIASGNFLPQAERFQQYNDDAFGSMGIQDKARYIATLFLEDISDFIKECIDEHFGFSRYAERLGRSANQFDELYHALQQPLTYTDKILAEILAQHFSSKNPSLIAISVPFPGNLFAAFRIAQWIKSNHPTSKVAMGGGFPNTELRSLKDPRVFEFFDFITLDDGEAPVEQIIKYINNEISAEDLKRTYLLLNGFVRYINNSTCSDYKQSETGTPDYSELLLDQYISAIDVVNPMHSLWSNGRWNKLTMAHGCYWGKCTFCDISLDYIQRYEPLTAKLLCDRMEAIIQQTGTTGFHFVDEAAPPSLMRSLALEIIKRKMVVSWWTNIRFEKSFTHDLCLLLKASGCIAVSGGLEVASNRLLELIEKGVTVEQVARVNRNFTEAGIMVHAYLMYGFPTQTDQETIDSLEMVRQMFKTGILQSAFWHQFAMTAHSPVGLHPEKFKVKRAKETVISFADNDVEHIDPAGADHEAYSYGLKKSLFNYMQGIGLDEPLHKWFDHKTPRTSVSPDYILNILNEDELPPSGSNTKVIFLGSLLKSQIITKSKKGNQWTVMQLDFVSKKQTLSIQVDEQKGIWLSAILPKISPFNDRLMTLRDLKSDYEKAGLEDFELFWDNKPVSQLYKVGLLRV